MATTRQNSETFRLRIEKAAWKRVKRVARKQGRTPASFVRQAVYELLAKHEQPIFEVAQ